MVRADLQTGSMAQFLNIWLYPSPADYNKTVGLCGNFDGDSTNDLIMRDGSLYTGHGSNSNGRPKPFSTDWRWVSMSIKDRQLSTTTSGDLTLWGVKS